MTGTGLNFLLLLLLAESNICFSSAPYIPYRPQSSRRGYTPCLYYAWVLPSGGFKALLLCSDGPTSCLDLSHSTEVEARVMHYMPGTHVLNATRHKICVDVIERYLIKSTSI